MAEVTAAMSSSMQMIAPSCPVTQELSDPIFLSGARSRSLVSGAQVRGMLEVKDSAMAPLPSAVRTDELLNYYHIDYPAQSDTDLTIVAELAPTEVAGDYLLQIGVQSPTFKAPRRRTSLTVVVDSSASMAGEPLLRANAAVLALARSLNKGDVLNFFTTDLKVKPVHRSAESDGDPALFSADQPIQVSGADGLGVGVKRAYEAAIAKDSYFKEGINRVVVITDGGGLPAAIDVGSIKAHWLNEQIQLVGVGVGSAPSYHNEVLAAATKAGHGANLYLYSTADANVALHQRFDEVMDEAAGALTVSFRLPWMLRGVGPDVISTPNPRDMLVSSDLARGRSMVFRHLVSVCKGVEFVPSPALSMEVAAHWSELGTTDGQTRKVSVPLGTAPTKTGSRQILKASAILAFGSALQSLEVARFQDACAKVILARSVLTSQPGSASLDSELDSILTQIRNHPVMKDLPCP